MILTSEDGEVGIEVIWQEVQGRMIEEAKEEYYKGEQRNCLLASRLWSPRLHVVKRGYFKDQNILVTAF